MALSAKDLMAGIPSSITSSIRAWQGTSVIKANIGKVQPEKMLILYDLEGCPFCRVARETLTELDLDVEIRPCPKGDEPNRKVLKERGGKVQMPYLIDPNTDTEMYESHDIINYLQATYGDGRKRGALLDIAGQITSSLASASRPAKGIRKVEVKLPEKMLELYSFESSPFSRPVRERLCELGIPYILRNLGKQQMSDMGTPDFRMTNKPYIPLKGSKREAFQKRNGKVQVPYLIDPNTQTEMFESQDIIEYLNRTYQK